MKAGILRAKHSVFRYGLFYGLPVVLYAWLIFVLSSLPQFSEELLPFIGSDKLAHFTEYFVFGILICRWFLNAKNRFVRSHARFTTMLVGTCYGISDEWHQSFIPGRVATIWDILFDAVGIAAAILMYHLAVKRHSPLTTLDKILERKFIDEA